MKKIFTSLTLVIAFGFAAQAQSLTFTPSKTITHSLYSWDIEELTIEIGLPVNADVTFAWKLIDNSLPEAWSYSLCDLGHCYVGIPDKATMYPLSKEQMDNGENGFFKLSIIAGEENYGKGKARLYVYDINNIEGGDTVTFDVEFAAPNSLEGIAQTGLSVYPNPNNGNFTIFTNSQQAFTYSLSAINGQVMAQGNSSEVRLEGLSRGVYFLQVTQANGTILTQKVLIN